MTWPGGGNNEGQGQPGAGWGAGGEQPYQGSWGAGGQQPHQGSYPTDPYQNPGGQAQPGPGGAGPYGGQQPDPYGPPAQPGQPGPYGQPNPYGQAGQHGQHGQYGQYGHGPQGPQQGGSKTGLLVALAAVGVVVVLGVVGGIYLLNRGGDDDLAGGQTTTTAPPVTTETPTTTETTTTQAEPTDEPDTRGSADKPDPVVEGWQVQTSSRRNLAYDVPPEWEVAESDTLSYGFEDSTGKPTISMSGLSWHHKDFCPEKRISQRAVVGVRGARGGTELDKVAPATAHFWAKSAYSDSDYREPELTVTKATPLTVNGIDGMYSIARATAPSDLGCGTRAGAVLALALPAPDGAYVVLVGSDQDVPEALTEDEMLDIIKTVRSTE